MCRPDTQPALLNESFAEKLGGENQMDFLVMTFCENVQDDDDLMIISKAMNMESLQILMKSTPSLKEASTRRTSTSSNPTLSLPCLTAGSKKKSSMNARSASLLSDLSLKKKERILDKTQWRTVMNLPSASSLLLVLE